MLSAADRQSLLLTLELAGLTTALLLVLSTPVAWWLARTRSRLKGVVSAVVALPLVLPPTVMGYYLLVAMGPQGWVGQATQALGLGRLPFSFEGLVVASVVYSLPFVVQPLQQAFEAVGPRVLEAAATLRAGPVDRFFSVALPLARSGYLTAGVLGFAHTVGEFGVVLMIGGSIPGETRVLSVALYEHVEGMDYAAADRLALGLVLFAFVVLLLIYGGNPQRGRRTRARPEHGARLG